MSELAIWKALRNAGLSEAGAAGMMGNMYCESLLQSNNVENRCPLSDAGYTSNVDAGRTTKQQFSHDAYGYGLCQWTYYTRKEGLYDLAKSRGVSISDENVQCEFCVQELKTEYSGLFQSLCTTSDVFTAASRICVEFERPAVNNVSQRAEKAQEYFNRYHGTDINTLDTTPGIPVTTPGTTESVAARIRAVRSGDKGRDVYLLQCALNDMGYSCGVADGDFGVMTLAALNRFKLKNNLKADGIADEGTWGIIFQ